jgi:hypothetical protein
MLAIVWTGYSYAAIARQFLIYDPEQPWFYALCQTALFETQTQQREFPSPVARRQMILFFSVLSAVTVWQFLPEFIFPFLSSLAFLCWVAPKNATANFISGGLGGMGFLNLSLDWSNVGNLTAVGSGNLFMSPWSTQVVQFLAFAISCWVLLPLAKWGGLGTWDKQLMSNYLYQGTRLSHHLPARPISSGLDCSHFTTFNFILHFQISLNLRGTWGFKIKSKVGL